MPTRSLAAPLAVVLLSVLVLPSCRSASGPVRGDRIRTFPEWLPSHHHTPIQLQVGWIPYEEWEVARDANTLDVMRPDSSAITHGFMPVMYVTYPDSAEGLWLDPDIDDALLGRLIKRSAMTQIPITRPFDTYFEVATCRPCHPENVGIRDGF